MFKVELNTSIPYNYSFYCPVAKISLNLVNKSALISELTPSIRRGILAKTLLYKEIIVNKEENGIEVNKKENEVTESEQMVKPKEEVKEIPKEEVKPKKEPKKKRKTSEPKSSKK